MADFMWIEHVGARGAAAMALMKLWGMLDGVERPEPNTNIRLVVEWLDRCTDDQPLVVLGSVIPMLEVVLDGSLCKFVLEKVQVPACHEAFGKIKDDEPRRLGVDLHVLEVLDYGKPYPLGLRAVAQLMNPPLLLGMDEACLNISLRKYRTVGGRTQQGRNNPWFQIISRHGNWVIDRSNWLYHKPVDALVKLTDLIPTRLMPKPPS